MRAILGSRMLTAGLAAFAMAMLMGFHVAAQTDPPVKGAVATAASTPKTAFQCEKRYKQASARAQCFNQLPGANCAHPLEAQKAGNTSRGASRSFKIAFREEPDGVETVLQTYAYAPQKNVGICPRGVVFRVSLLSSREHCERTPKGEEICSSEYGTKNIPEPSARKGGKFTYRMTNHPTKSGYLVVKGYYIHPPWQHRR